MQSLDLGSQVLLFILGISLILYVLRTGSKRETAQESKNTGNFPASHERAFDPTAELPKDAEPPTPDPPKDTELPTPDPPAPEKMNFQSSGQTYTAFKEFGCEEDENSIMTGTNVEICQMMCSNDSQCGRFTINDDGDCRMYHICTPKRVGAHSTLYNRAHC